MSVYMCVCVCIYVGRFELIGTRNHAPFALPCLSLQSPSSSPSDVCFLEIVYYFAICFYYFFFIFLSQTDPLIQFISVLRVTQ